MSALDQKLAEARKREKALEEAGNKLLEVAGKADGIYAREYREAKRVWNAALDHVWNAALDHVGEKS